MKAKDMTVTFWGRSPKAATYFHVYPVVQNLGTCSDLVGMEDRKRILCSEWVFVQLRSSSPPTGKEWRERVLENTGRHLAQYVTCVLNRLNSLWYKCAWFICPITSTNFALLNHLFLLGASSPNDISVWFLVLSHSVLFRTVSLQFVSPNLFI